MLVWSHSANLNNAAFVTPSGSSNVNNANNAYAVSPALQPNGA